MFKYWKTVIFLTFAGRIGPSRDRMRPACLRALLEFMHHSMKIICNLSNGLGYDPRRRLPPSKWNGKCKSEFQLQLLFRLKLAKEFLTCIIFYLWWFCPHRWETSVDWCWLELDFGHRGCQQKWQEIPSKIKSTHLRRKVCNTMIINGLGQYFSTDGLRPGNWG